jgi:hypothetical protein
MVAVVVELLTVRIMAVVVAREYLDKVPMVLEDSNLQVDIIMATAAAVAHVAAAPMADILAEVALVPGQAGAAAD